MPSRRAAELERCVTAFVSPLRGSVEPDFTIPWLTPWATDLLPLCGSSLSRRCKNTYLRQHRTWGNGTRPINERIVRETQQLTNERTSTCRTRTAICFRT